MLKFNVIHIVFIQDAITFQENQEKKLLSKQEN